MSIASHKTYAMTALDRGWTWLGVFLVILVLMNLLVSTSEAATGVTAAQDRVDPIQLNLLSQQLVANVKTGTAKATEFRTNVVFYRESLRRLMLANEQAGQPIAKPLLLQMVRMAALLQSAAECQTGRYITCPVNLLHELDRQQQQIDHAFANVKTAP